MRTRGRLAITLLSMLSSLALAAEDPAPPPPSDSAAQPQLVDVIVLGKRQFLDTPSGFPQFCAANADRDRLEIRDEVVAKLKAIAAEGRAVLEAAVGEGTPTLPLWLVSAIAARLPRERVAALRAHEDVHAVFAAGIVPAWREVSPERAPQVTGTVALMLSAHPGLTAWRVMEVLEETARDLPPKGKDIETGAGLLDAFAAVERVIALRDAKAGDSK